MNKVLICLDRFIDRISSYGLIFSVFAMLLLSTAAIVLRWFGLSFSWVEPFVRHLVFLSTFLGGVLATGRRTHIGIDILGKYIESKNNQFLSLLIERLTSLVSSLTLMWMIYASFTFFKIELKYGKEVFWGIHSGFLVGIIPVGFSLISIRFLIQFLNSFTKRELES